jgi:hypothetical protein
MPSTHHVRLLNDLISSEVHMNRSVGTGDQDMRRRQWLHSRGELIGRQTFRVAQITSSLVLAFAMAPCVAFVDPGPRFLDKRGFVERQGICRGVVASRALSLVSWRPCSAAGVLYTTAYHKLRVRYVKCQVPLSDT